MGAWLETYEKLTPEQQDRVQRWIHLNKFIARTLKLSFEDWLEKFVQPCMERPLDYSFMAACVPGFTGLEDNISFSKVADPALAKTSRVPLRAQNNLGRLSPELQDSLASLLEAEGAEALRISPADVAQLQKIFAKEKALAKLQRKDFRSVQIARSDEDIVVRLEAGTELLRQSLTEFGAMMRKPWV